MDLFTEYRLGTLTLKNRIVMAPMTRSRAVAGNVPSPLAPVYYAQRAGAGLIVTEASQVSPRGVGYLRTPGIHTPAQVAGWKAVTDAVHDAGGVIFLQLWHVGRVSHPDFHGGELPVAPSPIPFEGMVRTPAGRKPAVAPRALDISEIPGIVDEFRRGAANAKEAGFDGVELHGANGYLLDQFLRDGSNHRTDAYGGSIPNRARFPLEVVDAVLSVWGADRVGYRIAPPDLPHVSMSDSTPLETFSYLTKALNARRIGYLHVVEPIAGRAAVAADRRITPALRRLFEGALIVNGGYDAEAGHAAISSSAADLVAFGVPFIANPDLPQRFREGAPLNTPNPETFYAGEEVGYIDYPALAGGAVTPAQAGV